MSERQPLSLKKMLRRFPHPESELLLAHVLNKPKEFLHLRPETELTPAQNRRFISLCKKFKSGLPVAYLLGYKYFYGLRFAVNQNVLIPRPESEWLVEKGLAFLKQPKEKAFKVLDMGTGSGNIIISLAHTRSGSTTKALTTRTSVQWIGADVSRSALATAKKNAKAHKAKVKFIHSDLFGSLPGKYNLVIANLPYVPVKDYGKLKANLKYEPKGALTDGANDAPLIRRFISFLPEKLNDAGLALIEIDPSFKPILEKHIKIYNLPLKVKFFKDYRGLWRYGEITKNSR